MNNADAKLKLYKSYFKYLYTSMVHQACLCTTSKPHQTNYICLLNNVLKNVFEVFWFLKRFLFLNQ